MELTVSGIYDIKIDDLAYGGKGIGRIENFAVFVPYSVPGDELKIKITNKKSNFAEAEIISIIKLSTFRTIPECKIFGRCGGCNWLHINYNSQLKYKQKIVIDSFERIGNQKAIKVEEIIPSPNIFHYRNKMDFAFGKDDSEQFTLGFHKIGEFHRVINVENCLLPPPFFNDILKIIRRFTHERNLEPYNPITHTGFLRSLIVRHAKTSDEILISIFTNDGEFPDIDKLIDLLIKQFPNIKGIQLGIHRSVSDFARLDEEKLFYGQKFIIEKINGVQYRISPLSFFQTNTQGTEILYRTIKDFADLESYQNLLDLYSGTGGIALYLAKYVKKVVGIEEVKDAVWDARENATLNKIDNTIFLLGDVKTTLPKFIRNSGYEFDVIVVDPPRNGMHKKVVNTILSLMPRTLIYVSCNPTTLSRDIMAITSGGYKITKIQPIDMFPHTYHIETVVKLVKL